jgi:hypothetical protein
MPLWAAGGQTPGDAAPEPAWPTVLGAALFNVCGHALPPPKHAHHELSTSERMRVSLWDSLLWGDAQCTITDTLDVSMHVTVPYNYPP